MMARSFGDHHVAGLQVAVDQALRVNGCQAGANVARDLAKLVCAVATLGLAAADVRVERLAG